MNSLYPLTRTLYPLTGTAVLAVLCGTPLRATCTCCLRFVSRVTLHEPHLYQAPLLRSLRPPHCHVQGCPGPDRPCHLGSILQTVLTSFSASFLRVPRGHAWPLRPSPWRIPLSSQAPWRGLTRVLGLQPLLSSADTRCFGGRTCLVASNHRRVSGPLGPQPPSVGCDAVSQR